MKKIIFGILFSFILLSCSQTYVSSIKVKNLRNGNQLYKNSIIYNLPKTLILIDIELTKTIKIKGQFCNQADKLLNLKNVNKTNSVTWEITNVDFLVKPVIDSLNYYIVESSGKNIIQQISLSPEGFITGINDDNEYTKYQTISYNRKIQNSLYLPNSPNDSTDFSQYETYFRDIPFLKKQIEVKNYEDQALLIAQQILNLRDEKHFLSIGQGDTKQLPDGNALTVMINQINLTIEKYLTSFTGKIIKEKYYYRFEYIPSDFQAVAQKIICRFSSHAGLLSGKYIKGIPVYLELTAEGETMQIKKFYDDQQWRQRDFKAQYINNGIVYRRPGNAVIKLMLDNELIAQKNILVAQYGTTCELPAELFFTDNVIKFYYEYGSLKSVKTKKTKD